MEGTLNLTQTTALALFGNLYNINFTDDWISKRLHVNVVNFP